MIASDAEKPLRETRRANKKPRGSDYAATVSGSAQMDNALWKEMMKVKKGVKKGLFSSIGVIMSNTLSVTYV